MMLDGQLMPYEPTVELSATVESWSGYAVLVLVILLFIASVWYLISLLEHCNDD